VVGASVRGVTHAKTGQPCQDHHDWALLADGTLVAAVADGAGTAARAEVGAQAAVQAAMAAIASAWDPGPPPGGPEWAALLEGALRAARAALEREAEAGQRPLRDYAATLSLLVAREDCVAAAQIGDGALVARRPGGSMLALLAPRAGEYINETVFLISPRYLAEAQTGFWTEPLAELALFSDGLQRLALKMPEAAPHERFFDPLFRFATQAGDSEAAQAELSAFLLSPRVASRADDDLTLVLAARV
jgi:hypothetical protein